MNQSLVSKIKGVIDSLICINQELHILTHSSTAEGFVYSIIQKIQSAIGILSAIIEDSRPENKIKIHPNDFGIFEHLLPAGTGRI